MIEAKNWLPQNALLDGEVSEFLNSSICDWGSKWFVNPTIEKSEVQSSSDGLEVLSGEQYWQSSNGQLVAQLSDKDRLSIAEALLDKTIPKQKISNIDLLVLKKLVTKCVDDLFSSLIDTLDSGEEFEEFIAADDMAPNFQNMGYVLAVRMSDNTDLINIWMTENLVASARQNLLDPLNENYELGSVKNAISLQTVSLGAQVGSSKLGLSDLKKLSQGDVIILDNDLGASMKLTLNNKLIPSVRCNVSQDSDDESLKLTNICEANI